MTTCNHIASLVAAALSSVCAAQSFFGPIHYVSAADSPFDTSSPEFVLETFEDLLLDVQGVTGNGTPIGSGGLTDSVDADDGIIDGSGTNGHSYFANGQVGITFTFHADVLGGLPTQVGVVWTDGAGTTSFEAFDADGVSLGTVGPVQIADGTYYGTTGEDHFFGVSHDEGIGSVRITNTAGGIEVDHLQFMGVSGGCGASPDINDDGTVDAADLALLLGAWGRCADRCCNADLDRDGLVSASDLAILLGAWGS